MDELFGGIDGRCRVSITDSTMMWIVHQAMDKAHEKVKSKEGVVERLNEISKFYELAVMQLEGCLKFVQEETDSCILESNHEEVLADLKEFRDRLHGRLRESELAISDKDRELTERVKNEMKLRQALELKEREVVSLRADLEIERKKSEGIEEFVEDRDIGEFCELKNSVDQQVWNIKQKLEPDSYQLIDEERSRGIDNKRIEQMGLDIDMLKETLDIAFEKMQRAIFSSEMGPLEQQWRWSVEKDTISIFIKGLMSSIQDTIMIDKVSVSYAVKDQEEELKQEKEDANLQTMIIEEAYVTLLKGFMKEFFIELCDYDLECLISEGIYKGFFRETIIQWNENFESSKIEAQIREEIYSFVFGESIKSIVDTASTSASSQSQEFKLPDDFLHDFPNSMEFFQVAEGLGREDACMLLLREMVKQLKMDIDAHNMENLIREDIYQYVIVEAAKDAFILLREAEPGIQDYITGDKSYNGDQSKEQTENLNRVGLKSEEMEEQEILEEQNIDEEHAFSSVSNKLEKALHQLVRSKVILGEFGGSLGITVGDLEKVHAHAGGHEEGELDESDSVFSPLPVLLQVLVNFERVVHQKLGMNILRLEEVKYNLDPLVELVASLRTKELLYRKAFVRRCHNLHKSELEVDLLGDQVDVLLGLLEKIYTTLHHHSPALQQYFEVSDILNLIKKELTGGGVHRPNYEIRTLRPTCPVTESECSAKYYFSSATSTTTTTQSIATRGSAAREYSPASTTIQSSRGSATIIPSKIFFSGTECRTEGGNSDWSVAWGRSLGVGSAGVQETAL
ncbi:WPP domain-associated protein [Corylus avellana]|uniref:WPP domain-associated protein n=1 Tax=Corylus avellana TaxID=13451 RepID=UPI00286C30A3|nr:WPP domain-associated protein [Corylus avellana]